MKYRFSALVAIGLTMLAGCTATTQPPQSTTANAPQAAPVATRSGPVSFSSVVNRVQPVAEAECRRRTGSNNCSFKIVVDNDPRKPPNAFQTVDSAGRPVIGFTRSLIEQVRNPHELAFVMSHEAAHHIQGHLPRQRQNAMAGSLILGGIAAIAGADASVIDVAGDLGAGVGARSYSKNYELEADGLGTIISHRAGYDPVRGAQFFSQVPDPGNRFLGTHPPNAQRMATVRRVAAGL